MPARRGYFYISARGLLIKKCFPHITIGFISSKNHHK